MSTFLVYMGNSVQAEVTETSYDDRTAYEISIQGSGPMYDSVNDFTYPEGQTFNAWNTAVQRCKQSSLSISGPTTIADGCFQGLGEYWVQRDLGPGVNTVSICNSVTKIGNRAFAAQYTSELTKIEYFSIGTGVQWIGIRAFEYQVGITSLDFHGTPTRVDGGAFKDCHNLESITLSDDWEGIDYTGPSYNTFMNCYKLSSISPKNMTHTYKGDMYRNCNCLQNVHIKNTEVFDRETNERTMYVDLYAGSELNEEGYFITEVNTTAPTVIAWDWKGKWNRIIILYADDSVYLYHNGQRYDIGMYANGNIPLTHEGVVKFLQVAQQSGQSSASPLHMAVGGRWYQFKY